MALTITKDAGNYGALFTPLAYAKGQLKFLTGSIAFDDSYPTGGESMDLSAYFKSLKGVIVENKAGYCFSYDYANKKVLAYYGDNDGTSDGPMAEVTNGTNLSALTGVHFLAWGY